MQTHKPWGASRVDAASLGIIAAITVSQTPDSETSSATCTARTGGGAGGGPGHAWAPGLDPTLPGAWEAPAGLVGLMNPDIEVSRGHPSVVGMGPEDSEAQAGFPITRHLGASISSGTEGDQEVISPSGCSILIPQRSWAEVLESSCPPRPPGDGATREAPQWSGLKACSLLSSGAPQWVTEPQ